MVETRSQRKQAQAASNGDSPNNGIHNSTKNGSSSSETPPPRGEKESKHHENEASKSAHAHAYAHAEVAKTPIITIAAMILIAAISIFTFPESLQPVGRPTVNHVWYFGWISALSTGLGVLPLIFSPDFDTYWVGVTNGEKT